MTPLELLKNAPTPRTDKACFDAVRGSNFGPQNITAVAVSDAQELERQNAALREALRESNKVIRDACQATALYGDQPPGIYLDTMSENDALLAALEKE